MGMGKRGLAVGLCSWCALLAGVCTTEAPAGTTLGLPLPSTPLPLPPPPTKAPAPVPSIKAPSLPPVTAPAPVPAPVKAPSLPPVTAPVKAPSLPPVTAPVKLPSAPVKLPSAPVKVPSAPVKLPSAPVKLPSAPVKLPSAPVKLPSAPVRVPSAPVKAPSLPRVSPKPSVRGSAPVSAPAPRLPGLRPALPVPSLPVPAPRRSVAGSGGVMHGQVGAPPSSPAYTGTASSGYGTPGVALPPSGVTAPGAVPGAVPGAPRFPGLVGALTPATVVAYIRRLSGCLGAIPRPLRSVLRLLGGIGLPQALTQAQASARLRVPLARLQRMEHRALILLRRRARAGGCAPPEELREAEFLFLRGVLPGTAASALGLGERAAVASYRASARATQRRRPQLHTLSAGPGLDLSRPGADWIIALSAAVACLLALLIICARSFGVIGDSNGRDD